VYWGVLYRIAGEQSIVGKKSNPFAKVSLGNAKGHSFLPPENMVYGGKITIYDCENTIRELDF